MWRKECFVAICVINPLLPVPMISVNMKNIDAPANEFMDLFTLSIGQHIVQ